MRWVFKSLALVLKGASPSTYQLKNIFLDSRMVSRTIGLQGKPLEFVLNASTFRMPSLVIFAVAGHLIFGWLWTYWLPQPFESLWIRGFLALVVATLLAPGFSRRPVSRVYGIFYVIQTWIQLPLMFTAMYLINGGSTVWFGSMCAMLLIYYNLTDWRIATCSVAFGGLAGYLVYLLFRQHAVSITEVELTGQLLVFAFCWGGAILLGASSANMRAEQARASLSSMLVMASDMRSHIQTSSLIVHAMRQQSNYLQADSSKQYLAKLADRLQLLTRNIDSSISTRVANANANANAKSQSVAGDGAITDMKWLILQTVRDYPFESERERRCIDVDLQDGILVLIASSQFGQALENLLRNAIAALHANESAFTAGEVQIKLYATESQAVIRVVDSGIGMSGEVLERAVEPFYSSSPTHNHGLGLTYVKAIVEIWGGSINLNSSPTVGTSVALELPLAEGLGADVGSA
jgi:two-component system CAI-1 autoinducer sensor kinase/phosphatase CqsS